MNVEPEEAMKTLKSAVKPFAWTVLVAAVALAPTAAQAWWFIFRLR